MKGSIRRLFNLYEGEEKNAFLFGLLAFCWSLGTNLGLKFSDALLLIHVGASALPTIYILSASGMVIPAILLLLVVNRVSSQKIFYFVLSTVVVFYGAIFFCIRNEIGFENQWIWYILRIMAFQIDCVTITTFWTFIDQYHNMQDAKRIYVLFSLTVFCGQAFTGLIMQSGILSFTNVILVIISLMFISIYLVKVISKRMHLSHEQSGEEEGIGSYGKFNLSNTVRDILKSKFTMLVMLNNFLIFLMLVTAEYNYLDFFDKYFDPPGTILPTGGAKNAEITLFLGKLIATVSITNLIFGLFLYSRFIRRFGVTSLLFFTPIIMAFAMGGWSFHPVIVFPIIAYFLVEGFLEIIDESNFNLLLNAVPKRLKYRVRIMIESFFEPMAMLSGGFLLSAPKINTILLCLTLSLCALVVAFIIQKKYHSAVYTNLAANAIHPERSLKEWFFSMTKYEQRLSKEKLFQILKTSSDIKEQIFALNGLLGLDDDEITYEVLSISNDMPSEFQIEVLKHLNKFKFASKDPIIKILSSWLLEIKDPKVIAKLRYYLSPFGIIPPTDVINDIESDDLIKKATAIISLKRVNSSLQYKQIADNSISKMIKSDQEDQICMALEILSSEPSHINHQLFLSFLDHPNQNIRQKAIESFAKISNIQCRKYAKILISQMKNSQDSSFRKSCLIALGKMNDPSLIRDIIRASLHFRQSERRIIEAIVRKMGLSTVPMLLTLTKDRTMPDRCRALAGRILGHLALSHLHANLHDIINTEIERAYFYYFHYQTIQANNPDKDLRLLKEALETSYHSVLEFIIHILSAAGEIEDSELISRLFRSKDKKLQSQVVETLERTCDRHIFKSLRPLVENLPAKEIFERHYDKTKHSLSLENLLEILSQSSSPVDKIVSITLMEELNLPNWKDAVKKLASSNEEIFTHFAREFY